MSIMLRLQPRDPIVSRDGRPFGIDSGRRMRSLDWLLPSATAGAVRSLVGDRLGAHYHNSQFLDRLKAIRIRGPFPNSASDLYFPAAMDVVRDASSTNYGVRPIRSASDSSGVDLPGPLLPVAPPPVPPSTKFSSPPAWWSTTAMAQWLATPDQPPPGFLASSSDSLAKPPTDERTHVQIDPKTLAAKKGLLFSTAGLALDDWAPGASTPHGSRNSLTMAIDSDDPQVAGALANLDSLQPLGGERRLMRWIADPAPATGDQWKCPDAVARALQSFSSSPNLGIRMVLASPAVFEGGWRPAWLDPQTLEGSPPSCASVRLRLVGLVNDRWQAVSGWSYEHRGPKRIRRVVSAGATYFFDLISGSPTALQTTWLQSVSDLPEDQREGWGLALWGVWRAGASI